MKISTTWSQRDWDKALEKVWKLSRSFEEILEFGLEHNFITSSDIIHASDIYKDPNKEYEDDEIKEMIMSRGLRDTMDIIQEEYSLDDILDELPTREILENISEDDRLDSLLDSWVLENHDDEVREEYYREYIDEWVEEQIANENAKIKELQDANSDNLHEFICDLIGVGYYDKEGFEKEFNKLKDKLNKNSYGIKYE